MNLFITAAYHLAKEYANTFSQPLLYNTILCAYAGHHSRQENMQSNVYRIIYYPFFFVANDL